MARSSTRSRSSTTTAKSCRISRSRSNRTRTTRCGDQGAAGRDVSRRHAASNAAASGRQLGPPDEVIPHRQSISQTSRRTLTVRRRSSCRSDDLTIAVTMNRSVGGRSRSTWPGSVGYIGSPTWMAAADADPTLEAKPVGTGPFIFKDYKPDESFTATKNPNYWNKPYPYLDEVEFRPHPRRAHACASALEAGDVRPHPHDERRHDQEVPRRRGQLPDDGGDASSARRATRSCT